MCTVTYIPKGKDQFLLTSNRDENSQRATGNPEILVTHAQQTLFPKDPKSGGSWIAVSENNKLACVLNGAFKKHRHRPPYKRSRGLVLLDFFQFGSIQNFIDTYDFQDIEPFTLILYELQNLIEFRWDGQRKHQQTLDLEQTHIWSSCTLYDPEVTRNRATWFDQWLESNPNPEMHDMLDFHRYGGEQDQTNGFVMNRSNLVQTLSITGIIKEKGTATMHHFDLLGDRLTNHKIDLKNEVVESN